MKNVLIGSLVVVLCLAAGLAAAQQAAPPAPAAPASAAPAAETKAAAPASGLMIARMELASSIENRQPVGIAATFPATGPAAHRCGWPGGDHAMAPIVGLPPGFSWNDGCWTRCHQFQRGGCGCG